MCVVFYSNPVHIVRICLLYTQISWSVAGVYRVAPSWERLFIMFDSFFVCIALLFLTKHINIYTIYNIRVGTIYMSNEAYGSYMLYCGLWTCEKVI